MALKLYGYTLSLPSTQIILKAMIHIHLCNFSYQQSVSLQQIFGEQMKNDKNEIIQALSVYSAPLGHYLEKNSIFQGVSFYLPFQSPRQYLTQRRLPMPDLGEAADHTVSKITQHWGRVEGGRYFYKNLLVDIL